MTRLPPPDVGDYRRAMSRFATGVSVVTTLVGEHHHAMTANALCSVSLEPLLMLVSVERDARFHDAVVDSGVWGVSVLPAEARSTADWFATKGRPLHGQLDRVPHERGPVTGVAWLDGALSHFECRTTAVHPAGDHSIVLGEVVSVHAPDHLGKALLYYRGRYEDLA